MERFIYDLLSCLYIYHKRRYQILRLWSEYELFKKKWLQTES